MVYWVLQCMRQLYKEKSPGSLFSLTHPNSVESVSNLMFEFLRIIFLEWLTTNSKASTLRRIPFAPLYLKRDLMAFRFSRDQCQKQILEQHKLSYAKLKHCNCLTLVMRLSFVIPWDSFICLWHWLQANVNKILACQNSTNIKMEF